MLCLIVMLAYEPILRCINEKKGEEMFGKHCAASSSTIFWPYSVFSMFAMILYYVLVIDLAVFNNQVSAYVLVCGRMLAEVSLCLLGLGCVLLTTSSALSCLDHSLDEFHGIHTGVLDFWKMLMRMKSGEDYDKFRPEPVVFIGIYVFLVITVIFLVNLLIAQLSCAYDAIYSDMVGYARLKRIRIIVESMPGVHPKKWDHFVKGLGVDKRIEFNEGDVGVTGGIQMTEPASVNPTTVDIIKRFGGSTSPTIPWPEEDAGDDDSDRFERLELLIKKSMERITERTKKKGGGVSSSGLSGGLSGSAGGGSGCAGEAEGSQGAVEVGEEEAEA
jgi:uncharacterized membrane protein YgcG